MKTPKQKPKSQSDIEMSELRKSVTELSNNYSSLIKTMNEYFIMGKPLFESMIKEFEAKNEAKNKM